MMTSRLGPPLIVGIDVGTTSVKIVAVAHDRAEVLASWSQAYSSQAPTADAHEQDPGVWWRLVVEGLAAIGDRVELTQVAAVGLSGHMHSLLLLDDEKRPVHPALTWADRRCVLEAEQLAAVPRFRQVGGNSVIAAFTAPKLAWFTRSRQAELPRARHLLLAKDYIRLCLTEDLATDLSDAIGTLLYDPRTGQWDNELLAATGAQREWMPKVRESTTVAGSITKRAAEVTGLAPGTPVAIGAGDVAAAVAGMGITDATQVGINVGTAAQALALSGGPDVGECILFGSPWSDGFVRMAPVYAAGASIQWFEQAFLDGRNEPIEKVALRSTPGARGLGYLPLMFGASVPQNNDSARACFFEQNETHELADFARAVIESVAFYSAYAIQHVTEEISAASEIRVVGGVTQSQIWRDAFTSVVDAPVVAVPDGGSAMGAALVAGVGVELWDTPETAAALPRTVPLEAPSNADRHNYRKAATRFAATYDRMVTGPH